MTTPYEFGYEIGQLKFAAAPMTEQQYRLADIEAKKNRLRGLGNQVKQVTPAANNEFDADLKDEIAGVRASGNQLDSAPDSRLSGNSTGSFTGGHLTTVNGQRQRLSAAQQEDVDAAKEMSNSFNNMNASAGGAGRGGMAPQAAPAMRRPAATTPPPARGMGSMSQMARPMQPPAEDDPFKEFPAPATTPPPVRRSAPMQPPAEDDPFKEFPAPATTPPPVRRSAPMQPPAAQTPAQNLAAMRVAQSKADAAAVRGASGTPNPMGNGLHSFSGRVGGPGAPTGTYTPPAGRPMPKLPSGPTSSPNFKGAVE